MAAKQTSSLIPLCHPLPLSGATIDFTPGDDRVVITATVKTRGVTGVEMEALTAASVAALTLYDMIKAVDKHVVITDIHVIGEVGRQVGRLGRRMTVDNGRPGGDRGAPPTSSWHRHGPRRASTTTAPAR